MEASEAGEEGGKYTLGRFGVLTRVATAILSFWVGNDDSYRDLTAAIAVLP